MDAVITLKNKLLTNTIFSEGFYFKDTYEFLSSGVDDRNTAMFYLRHSKPGTTKFRVKFEHPTSTISTSVRLVVQLPNRVNKPKALATILAQIQGPCTTIEYYSDDTKEIFFSEYKKEAVIRDFYLLSFDIVIIQEEVFEDCDDTCLSC